MEDNVISRRIASVRWSAALVLCGFILNAGLIVLLVSWISHSTVAAFVALTVMAAVIALFGLYAHATTRIGHARAPLAHEYQWLQPMVDELARDAGLPSPTVRVVDDPTYNASALGSSGGAALITFWTGLLENFPRDEVRAVAAHEIGHVLNRDTPLMLWTGAMFSWVMTVRSITAFLSYMIFAFSKELVGALEDSGPIGVLVGIVLAVIGFIFGAIMIVVSYAWAGLAQMMRMTLSRQREFLADATGAALIRDPETMSRALARLATENPAMRHDARVVGAFCIASPIKAARWWDDLWSTHPPLQQRIDEVRKLVGGALSLPGTEWRGVGSFSLLLPGGAIAAVASLALLIPLVTGGSPNASAHSAPAPPTYSAHPAGGATISSPPRVQTVVSPLSGPVIQSPPRGGGSSPPSGAGLSSPPQVPINPPQPSIPAPVSPPITSIPAAPPTVPIPNSPPRAPNMTQPTAVRTSASPPR